MEQVASAAVVSRRVPNRSDRHHDESRSGWRWGDLDHGIIRPSIVQVQRHPPSQLESCRAGYATDARNSAAQSGSPASESMGRHLPHRRPLDSLLRSVSFTPARYAARPVPIVRFDVAQKVRAGSYLEPLLFTHFPVFVLCSYRHVLFVVPGPMVLGGLRHSVSLRAVSSYRTRNLLKIVAVLVWWLTTSAMQQQVGSWRHCLLSCLS